MKVLKRAKKMIIFISIVVFAALIYFGLKMYQYDNSPFKKEHGFSFFQTLTNSKIHAYKTLYDQLVRTDSDAKVLFNVQIDEATHQNFADIVVIHPSGIYVVLVQPKKGWISGTEKSYEWVEQLHGGKVNPFPNPIHVTESMASAIIELVPTIEREQIKSVVLFSNDCSFQRIELSSDSVEVLKYSEISRWVKLLEGQVIPKDQINSIYISLKTYSNN